MTSGSAARRALIEGWVERIRAARRFDTDLTETAERKLADCLRDLLRGANQLFAIGAEMGLEFEVDTGEVGMEEQVPYPQLEIEIRSVERL